MTLGVILAIGESMTDLASKGQADRMIKYNIKKYSENFEKVFIFSYANEKWANLPKNCIIIPNQKKINRFAYCLSMPFINKGYFLQCNALRGFQITGGIPAGVARIFLKKKYLVNYGYDYSYVARIEGKYIQSIVFPLLTKLICFGASRILVSSSRFKKNIYTPLSQARVTTIPNGVDTKLFKPSNAKEKADLRVLYVGRLEREKNLTNLLESTVGIPNVNLTLVGSGSLETELKNVARKLNIKVNFVKKLDYHKLAKFYRQFDIFILPSFTEGHSKVLLEAQASGLVCIASNIPGNREIITNNKNGLLCSLDSQSINKSLTTVVKDRNLRERLSKSARSNAQRKFEISKLLEKEVLIIKSLAN